MNKSKISLLIIIAAAVVSYVFGALVAHACGPTTCGGSDYDGRWVKPQDGGQFQEAKPPGSRSGPAMGTYQFPGEGRPAAARAARGASPQRESAPPAAANVDPADPKTCTLTMRRAQPGVKQEADGKYIVRIAHGTVGEAYFAWDAEFKQLDVSKITNDAERALYKETEGPAEHAKKTYVCAANKGFYIPILLARYVTVECQHGKAYALKLVDFASHYELKGTCSDQGVIRAIQ